ncbi:MAG: hypothetical protein Fur0039_17970 [Rhodocyclaceae bacterium]
MRRPAPFIPHGGGPFFFMDRDPPDTWARHRAFLVGWHPASSDHRKYAIEALRVAANPCEPDRKACRYAYLPWTIKGVFRLDWLPMCGLNLVCFSGAVRFRFGNRTRVRRHSR